MSSLDYFIYLAGGTGEFLAYFSLVTVPVGLVACSGVAWVWGRAGVRRGRVVVACIAPALVPVLILMVGVAFVRPERTAWGQGVHPPVPRFTGMPGDYPQSVLGVLSWLSVSLGLGLGLWLRRGWPVALASTLWWGWVSMCAGLMAGMSVTGVWL